MGFVSRFAFAAALTGALVVATHPAFAGCRRMGFTVNDYGKEGPTRDAKNLLDKHIATWAAEQGIEKYSIGKKDVSCELYLNLILFDEHTCTATATVCWGADINKGAPQEAKSKSRPALKKEAAAKSSEDKADRPAETPEQAQAEEKSEPAKAPESEAAAAPADEARPEETQAAETKPEEAPATEPAVETGAIPVPPTAAGAAAAVSPAAVEPVQADTSAGDGEASKAAAAAAESAAAAAERAAAAAERAAQAAERAAAAMAQQQAQPPAATPSGDTDTSAPASGTSEPSSSADSVPVAPVSPTP